MSWLAAIKLALAIAATHPDADPMDVAAVSGAIVRQHGEHSPELLAALMSPESGYDNRKVNPRSGACGVGQVLYYRHNRQAQARRCRRVQASVDAGVAAAAIKLSHAVEYCRDLGGRPMARRFGLEACAVAGYIGGVPGVNALGFHRSLTWRMVRNRLAIRDQIAGWTYGSFRKPDDSMSW